MSLGRQDLDDTYDLLSPVRRSNNSYSSHFDSENDTTGNTLTSPGQARSSSYSTSHKLPLPKYSSTTRYSSSNASNVRPATSPARPATSPALGRKAFGRHSSPVKARTSHDSTKQLMKIPQEGDNSDLSVWEDWLVRKLQDERERLKIQKIKEKEEKENEEKMKREKEQNQRKAELKHRQWCEEKNLKEKLQRVMQKRQEELEKERQKQEKQEINRKASAAYQKWFEKQKEEERQKKKMEEMKKKREQQEKEEKKKRNEECFQEWLKKANEKYPPSPRDKTTGPSEYPTPGYKNPKPWVGPMSDRVTRDAVRQQHKEMIAQKHEGIRNSRSRPQASTGRLKRSEGKQRKGLITVGPEKNKGVLICRPASATPLFYRVPPKHDNFMTQMANPSKGRS